MTLNATSFAAGGKVDANGIGSWRFISTDDVYIYTAKATGYVYWTAGNIVVNGVVFALSAGNSGAAEADKLIVATLTEAGSTAAITFSAPTTVITDSNKILLGYVDGTYRLNLFSASAQPNFSGYTFTKATANVSVASGEGYFLYASCFAWANGHGGSGPVDGAADTTARVVVTIDSTAVIDENNTDSDSSGVTAEAHAISIAHAAGPIKFNASLAVTFTATATGSGVDSHEETDIVCYYLVK